MMTNAKKTTIELSGMKVFLDVLDDDQKIIATRSGMQMPKLIVDEKEYALSELTDESAQLTSEESSKYEDVKVKDLAKLYNASAICRKSEKGSIILEIVTNGEPFDPKKLSLVSRQVKYAYHPEVGEYYPTAKEDIIVGLIYDGEFHAFCPLADNEIPGDKVWWSGCTD